MLLDTPVAPTVPGSPACPGRPRSQAGGPHRLDNGDWGSIYSGDTSALPSELVGAHITVQLRDGQSWTTTVTAVLERSSEQVIVTDSGAASGTLSLLGRRLCTFPADSSISARRNHE